MIGLLVLVGREQAANLAQFLRRRPPAGERLDDELGRRPAKRAIEQIGQEPPLGFFLGVARRDTSAVRAASPEA